MRGLEAGQPQRVLAGLDPTVSLCPSWQALLFVPSPQGHPAPLRSPGQASPRWQLQDQVPGEVLPDHPVAAWWG